MNQHLPILQVIVPLMGAPLCVMVRHRLLARGLSTLLAMGCFGMALSLLAQVRSGGAVRYQLGGFPPPLGIEYHVDLMAALLLVIVTTIAAAVFAFGASRAGTLIPEGREHLYYAAMLLCLSGLLGMAITGDAFNVFVFLEISSLSSYALIALGAGRRAYMSAFSYLIMGTIGGTFFLLGVGLLYQITGTLNMADLARLLQEQHENRTYHVAFAFLCVGLSLKLAVFPLHQWLPNAYTFAPPAVSAFLSATATKVMFYVLARVIFSICGAAFVFGVLRMHLLMIPLSLGAMFVGSLAAVYQKDVKRLLAYSSVAQIGYMTLGLSFNSLPGLTAGLVHLFNHALMKGGLFLVVACVAFRLQSTRLEDFAGLGRRMPVTMAAFVVGGLSLIGVPATVGFISKWYLVTGAIEQGYYAIALLILLSSLLAVAYVWRVVEVAYFRECTRPEVQEAPLRLLLPTWALIGATIVFGLSTDWTVGVAQGAAQQLLGVGL